MRAVGQVVERRDLERVAAILGPASAAAEALNWADANGGDVTFFQMQGAVVVVRNEALCAEDGR